MFGEKILGAFACSPAEAEQYGATANYTLENALDFAKKTVPGFFGYVEGSAVLDFGCGQGWQAVALARAGAREVLGIDIDDARLAQARALAEAAGVAERVGFASEIPPERLGRFDVVISLCAFEHYQDPAGALDRMRRAVKPGGRIIVSFAEPWLSHSGSHMNGYVRIPWVNLLFPEKTVMRFRSRYRNDGATRYEDVVGGLNRMTLAKFERVLRASGLVIERLQYHATRGLPLVTRIPLVRELLTSAATAVLRAP
jgi:SAM-dependent methyltransferase